jgi:hypothetical protein
MDPVGAITNWFKMLAMGRVHGAKAAAKGKLYGHQAKIKGKVAGTFNKGIDGAMKGAKGTVKGGKPGAKKKKKASGGGSGGAAAGGAQGAAAQQQQGQKMGLFGKKDKGVPEAGEEMVAPAPDEHTLAMNVDEFDLHAGECVGWVVVRSGDHKGRDYRLVAGKNAMGTAADCDVVLTDAYLSAQHAVIRYEDGDFILSDLDSTNGTIVNDTRVVKTALVDNDTIRVGRTELKFKALE